MAVRSHSVLIVLALCAAVASTAQAQNGLQGEYYASGGGGTPQPPPGSPAGTTSTATPLATRIDPTIDFGFANPPAPGVPADGFMVAWSGRITITTGGDYQFRLRIDDGGRMWINGTLVPLMSGTNTNSWIDQGPTDWTGTVAGLAAGTHQIRVEFYENGGGEECRMSYSGPDNGNVMGIVPTGVLQPPAPPPTPTIAATQSANFANAADVSWSNSGAGVTYELQRSTSGGLFTTIANGGMTVFQDTNLNYGTQYCYRVRATQGQLSSVYSTAACVTLATPPPRTEGHDEGLLGDNCACGSTVGVASTMPAAFAALLALALWGRRRRA